ncbi:MAG: hypothetical protein PHE86_05915 [Candidatus Marinimicrobia bacterium]|nr:hypothetical protein [Candidatus Neomarinimicrobiota bacterium]MDD5582789.1 hypothetical protein [Candidatus Neomarinimicrobiota bacterium]
MTHTIPIWPRKIPQTKGGIGNVQYFLVADITPEIAQKHGVGHLDSVAICASFLIDKAGIVQAQLVNNFNLERNVDEMLRLADALAYTKETEKHIPAN